jgi:alpha-L-fucosidase 2
MLVQSTEDNVWLLPALPSNWPRGVLKGVRARGGVELDFAWDDGRVNWVEVRAAQDCTIILHAESSVALDIEAGLVVRHEFWA